VLQAIAKAAQTQSQKPEDFIPVRRVYKAGNRFLFDDLSTGSYSGGGGGGSVTVSSESTNYTLRKDDTSTTSVTYLGEAAIGSATSAAVWRVRKIDKTSDMVITWADGDDLFDNVWDDRVSLTYN